MKLFHGTSAPNIERFQLGMSGTGEIGAAVNGIWLCTSETGAITHASQMLGGGRLSDDRYIYECRLHPEAVVADPMAHDLPRACMDKLVARYLPWYLRLAYLAGGRVRERYVCCDPWYAQVSRLAAGSSRNPRGSALKNAVIAICRTIGVDALIRPSTTWAGSVLQNYDESFYGDVYLVLDCEKVRPVKVAKVD